MNTKRRRTWLFVSAGLAVAILVLVILLKDNGSPQYQTYQKEAEAAGIVVQAEWQAKQDANKVCYYYSHGPNGNNPKGFYNHDAQIMALVKGYCPEYIDVVSLSFTKRG